MKNELSDKSLIIIGLIFIISAISVGYYSFHFSKDPGSWTSSIFLGLWFGWAIIAPIIRIKLGSLPFLKTFAVLPVLLLPVWFLNEMMSTRSPLFIFFVVVHGILSLVYLAWLYGLFGRSSSEE